MSKKFAENANQLNLPLHNVRLDKTALSQLGVHEFVGYLIHKNSAFKSPKAIAVELGCSLSTVYRLTENPKEDGIEITFDRLLKLARITKTKRIVFKYINSRIED